MSDIGVLSSSVASMKNVLAMQGIAWLGLEVASANESTGSFALF
jgi:hypothetical protein